MRTLVVDGVTRKPVKWVSSRWVGLRWGSAYTARTGHDVYVVAPRTARGQRVVDRAAVVLRDKPGVVVNNPLPPHPGWIAAAAVAVIGIWYAVAASSKPAQAQPSGVSGLTSGNSYRIVVRVDQAVQAAPILAQQGFKILSSQPNAGGDPYVFDLIGTYNGTSGELHDGGGLTILDAYSTNGQHVGMQYVTERPINLQPGATYFGRGDVGAPLSWAVTRAAMANKLASLGFVNIQTYTDADDLPSSWPSNERDGNRFATGLYPSTAQPQMYNPPSQIVSIWKVG